MLPGTENLPGLIPYKKTSSLFQKDKVIRKCMVHYLNKDVPSSSESRKCFYYIDTDEIPGFLLLLKNHIFTARSERIIFIFHM